MPLQSVKEKKSDISGYRGVEQIGSIYSLEFLMSGLVAGVFVCRTMLDQVFGALPKLQGDRTGVQLDSEFAVCLLDLQLCGIRRYLQRVIVHGVDDHGCLVGKYVAARRGV